MTQAKKPSPEALISRFVDVMEKEAVQEWCGDPRKPVPLPDLGNSGPFEIKDRSFDQVIRDNVAIGTLDRVSRDHPEKLFKLVVADLKRLGPHRFSRQMLKKFGRPEDRGEAKRRALIVSKTKENTERAISIIQGLRVRLGDDNVYDALVPSQTYLGFVHSDKQLMECIYSRIRSDLPKAESALSALSMALEHSLRVLGVDPQRGRPADVWRQNYVASLAAVWMFLTGAMPSSNSDSRFLEFLDAVWHDIDPGELYPCSWDRALRWALSKSTRFTAALMDWEQAEVLE
jgi:hypothetical protein